MVGNYCLHTFSRASVPLASAAILSSIVLRSSFTTDRGLRGLKIPSAKEQKDRERSRTTVDAFQLAGGQKNVSAFLRFTLAEITERERERDRRSSVTIV